MNDDFPAALRALVETYAAHPHVEALALGGSRASRQDDTQSDYDIYIFTSAPIPGETRRDLAHVFDVAPEIGNPWWGDEDAWTDGETLYDISYWPADDFERGLRQVIEQHRPSLGYTTSFWYTIRNASPLYDRDGWLSRLQELVGAPYPDGLRDAVVAHNTPLLRTVHASYFHQIELAVNRNDPVSVNHRIAALLASVFDIVFAWTGTLHPGEKRQLAFLAALGDRVPASLDLHIRELLIAAGDPELSGVMSAVNALCDDIHGMIGPPPRT